MDLDLIGKLVKVISDHPTNPVVEELPGYHVNSTRLIPGMSAYRITPATPSRVFAGAQTFYYRFADEAQAKALLGVTDANE